MESKENMQWISTKDRLPTGLREAVLVLCAWGTMFISYLDNGHWYAITPKGGVPLTFIPFYWMPLPEPPPETRLCENGGKKQNA